ncbi:auxin-responsive protein IAA33 [Arachis duranensis]|uniref:Auxin-induced protein n=1 Tax=Arachis duranensis TaxID=130453 RepID=A0A6P4B2S0_ARADU|nr:auxin-responsive protein IAA33 [Arachis duranensis]XP_057748826.1 auxin-responsive protein IAA33 isoform X1 [Arachis stenosperma]
MMNSFDPSLKRRWQESSGRRQIVIGAAPSNNSTNPSSSLPFYGNKNGKLQGFPGLEDDDLVSTVVPAVTVVLEGRSICHRISLHNHGSYQSLAKALRQMFVDGADSSGTGANSDYDDDNNNNNNNLDLSNAIPGHLIAYEDIENDLLLAGDLSWKDFVRVAKRIRIVPAKGNSRSRKGTSTREE